MNPHPHWFGKSFNKPFGRSGGGWSDWLVGLPISMATIDTDSQVVLWSLCFTAFDRPHTADPAYSLPGSCTVSMHPRAPPYLSQVLSNEYVATRIRFSAPRQNVCQNNFRPPAIPPRLYGPADRPFDPPQSFYRGCLYGRGDFPFKDDYDFTRVTYFFPSSFGRVPNRGGGVVSL